MSVALLVTAALVAARMGGAVMVMPVFNTLGIPTLSRLAVALGLTFVVTPVVPPASAPTLGLLVIGMAGEVVVGIAMGGTVAVLFGALSMASEFMGLQIGLRIAALFDPLSKGQTGLIASMSRWLGTLVFLGANLHLALIETIGRSFQLVPPGSASQPLAAGALWIPTVGHSIECGVRLAGPLIVLIFVIQAFMGIMVRLAPSMNVFFAVGLVVSVMAGLGLYHECLPTMLNEHLRIMEDSLHLVGHVTDLVR